ncbi:hypothetical protein [Flavobacterium sp. B17]|uniref:hypothetical protein n=1 Tax=Flavobacterium sp. B17 TaxID=95618 RepID=UPI000347C775|nr:hypothetical protein [Flavobacterium sp. B17]
MKGRFYQYVYSLLFALLTVLGWYYGQVQQYMSGDDSSRVVFLTNDVLQQNKKYDDSYVFTGNHTTADHYGISHPHYNKLKANLSENDNENDDNIDSSESSEMLGILREGLWDLISGFVTTFHDRKIAVTLAHSGLLKTLHDDLYIQYRVIRL